MKKEYKILLAVFFVVILIKIILGSFVGSATIFNDEYQYVKLARAFFHEQTFTIHGEDFQTYPPLYPIIISAAYVAEDMHVVYWFMKLINAIISSLVIFPVFWLARELLPKKDAILTAIISVLLPSHVAISPYILSENLFYPLAMLACLFIYKSFTEKSKWWEVGLGVILGLCLLTRIIGAILVGVVVGLVAWKLLQKDFLQLKRKCLAAALFIVTILPWVIYKGTRFGFTLNGIFGGYVKVVTKEVPRGLFEIIISFVDWFVIYLAIIGLAVGVLLFITNWNSCKERWKKNKLFYVMIITTFILTLLVVAKYASFGSLKAGTLFSWLTGRPIGRYAFFVLPLVVIAGIHGLSQKTTEKFRKTTLIGGSIIGLSILQVVGFGLFPVNNIPLSWIGAITRVVGQAGTMICLTIIIIAAIIISIKLLEKKSVKHLGITLTLVFCILVSLLSFGMTAYNAKTKWQDNEQMEVGKWINNNIESGTIVFDKTYCQGERIEDKGTSICHPRLHTTLAGLWINHPIQIKNVEDVKKGEYIITMQEFKYNELTSTAQGIRVYRKE